MGALSIGGIAGWQALLACTARRCSALAYAFAPLAGVTASAWRALASSMPVVTIIVTAMLLLASTQKMRNAADDTVLGEHSTKLAL